jgi:tetratricopeptide (TPR) repeat protein
MCSALLCIALAFAGRADAQRQRNADLRRAVLLFEESEELYNRGDFEGAATLLRRAYELHPDPTLVYNLGRSLEAMGDLDGAIEEYERYLREAPEAEDRGEVEAQLRSLRERRDRLAEATEEPAGDPIVEPGPDDEEPDANEGGGISPWPFVMLGAGGVFGVVGGVCGLVGGGVHDDAVNEPVQAEAFRLQDQADNLATVANVFFIAGAVALAAGVVVLVVELTSGDDQAALDAANGIVARF